MDEAIKNEMANRLNELGGLLTLTARNIKIMHWNYHDKDFVSVHPWLDEVYEFVNDSIDEVFEELRKGALPLNATYTAAIQYGTDLIMEYDDKITYDNPKMFHDLRGMLDILRSKMDQLATFADENKVWTVHEMANGMLAKTNHFYYFANESILA